MIRDASRLTTFVLTYVESLFAIALLGVLQQGGPQLFSGFHMAMALAGRKERGPSRR
jgi:hypothetical protein